jgi:sec-independent protein translocase protein TatC
LKDLPLIEHLNELRKRLSFIIFVIIIFFVLGFYFSNRVIEKIINDLVILNIRLVTLSPLEYILTQIKVGFLSALFIASPLIVYEALIFIKPALTKKEKNAIRLILPSFTLLFLAGIVFAYFVFLRICVYFLANLPIEEVLNLWSINKFISFVFMLCFSFGLIFQLPLLLLILNKLNIVNIKFLRKYRKHIYVLIFILAALITPPDIVTLLITTLPLILLYEASLVFARLF